MITVVAVASCVLAVVPCALFLRNLSAYRRLDPASDGPRPSLSVLIPARNEELNIAGALHSILQSEGADLEVIVLDDGSVDGTAAIVREFAQSDARVRLETSAPLPGGWCGKPFACHQLAGYARHSHLVFIDADVRVLTADALARLAAYMERSGAAMVSGVPRQETGGALEKLIIPLIHFILLGFLPLEWMRQSTDPRFAAGCGQMIAVRGEAYWAAGGHGAIAQSLHDGVALARSLRSRGHRTDLFDATDTFGCRMYRSASEVWDGFAKNAHEALASPRLIVPASLMLLGGQVVPLAVLALASSPVDIAFAALGTAAAFLPRLVGVIRFRQSLGGALLHPVGIGLLVSIQWSSFFRQIRRRPAVWKGRSYASAHSL